jgi:hypothetical protein
VTVDQAYPNLDTSGFCSLNLVIYNVKYIKFTATADGDYTVGNCGDTTGSVDARIAVLTACGDATTTVACDDDGCTNASPWASKVTFTGFAGTTYYFAVGGYDNTVTGPFNVTIEAPLPPANPADLNGDGVVNAADLSALLGNWGGTGVGDINGDGAVGAADLAALLGAWTS